MKRIGLVPPFVALVLFGLLYHFPIPARWIPRSGWGRLPFSPQLFFLVASGIILAIRRIPWRETGLSRNGAGRNLAIGVFLGSLPVALALGAGLLLTEVNAVLPFLPRPIFGGAPLDVSILPYDLVTLLLLAPICEEIFFRGILLRAIREDYPAWIAVVASALIFMGGHGKMAFGPLALGLINGIVLLRTGSILPGIAFHSIANAYGPVMILWFPNLYRYLQFLYSYH
jgi:membrane protease YdiL (CAAX protease family)